MYPTESLSPDLSRSRARAAVLSRDFVLAERLYKNLLKKQKSVEIRLKQNGTRLAHKFINLKLSSAIDAEA